MAKRSNPNPPWERQEGESEKAFEAFHIYLLLGENRSLRKVEEKLDKSHTLIGRWSAKYNWFKRVREYDNYLVQAELEEQQKQVKNMRKRQIQTAVLLQKKAIEALDKLGIENLPPKDILRFIIEGAKLEKETRSETSASATDNTPTISLADTIIAAYKRRQGDDDDE